MASDFFILQGSVKKTDDKQYRNSPKAETGHK